MGVIDSITAGFNLIRRRPVIMLLPILLDLVLWMAPQLSIEPLTNSLVSAINSQPDITSTQSADTMQTAVQFLSDFGKDSNLLSLLAAGLYGVPSIIAGGLPSGMSHLASKVLLDNTLLAMIISLVLGLSGIALTALYMTIVVNALLEQKLKVKALLIKVGHNCVKLILLTLIFIAVSMVIGVPVSLFISFITLLSPGVGSFLAGLVSLLAIWLVLWLVLYLFFTVDAIVLQQVGIWRAMLSSAMVVRSSFWSSVGFILLTNIITAGLAVIWQWLSMSTIGLIVGVAGNAFIGTGLVAAGFMFYRDRFEAFRSQVMQSGRSS